MDVIKRALRSYICRRRLQGLRCPCGIRVAGPISRYFRPNYPSGDLCNWHSSPANFWRTSLLHQANLSVAAFRTELLRNYGYYRKTIPIVYVNALKRGDAYVVALLTTHGYSHFWNRKGAANAFKVPEHFLDYLQRGYVAAAALVRTWSSWSLSIHALREFLSRHYGGFSPQLRDELRKPEYAKMLKAYVAEESLRDNIILYNRQHIIHFLRHVAFNTREAHKRLLGFWFLTVKAKIRHWRTAGTFRPVPAYAGMGTDTLDVLVQRSPAWVPAATEAFRAACENPNTAVIPTTIPKAWLALDTSFRYLVEACVRLSAWQLLLETLLPAALATNEEMAVENVLDALETVLEAKSDAKDHTDAPLIRVGILAVLENYQNPLTDTETIRMALMYKSVCYYDDHFYTLLNSASVFAYTHEHRSDRLVDTLAEHFITDAHCLHMAKQPVGVGIMGSLFWNTTVVQQRLGALRGAAAAKIGRFMLEVRDTLQQRRAFRVQAVATHKHAWESLVCLWRWWRAPRRECPICMETGSLVVLHRDRRHAICRECLDHVVSHGGTSKCPLCRQTLGNHEVPSHDDETASIASDYSDRYQLYDHNYDYGELEEDRMYLR